MDETSSLEGSMLRKSQSRGNIPSSFSSSSPSSSSTDVSMLKRTHSRGTIVTTSQDSSGSVHTYSEEEKEGLVDYINALLARKQQRPINTKTNEIFESLKDGVLLCRLVNAIQPNLIDEFRIHTKDNLSIFEKGENLMLALQTSQDAFNISLVNIGVQDVLEGRPVLVLALLWQLITVDLRTRVRFHSREIEYLLEDELDGADVVEEPEGLQEEYKIILRWVNHHLSLAGVEKRVHNFSNDFKDAVALTVLLNRLAPRTCTLDALKEPLISVRASLLLQSAELIGCNKFMSANDLMQGNARSIFAFLAYLFTRFNKPVEIRKVEERIEEKAIELADIHQEIESIVDNISHAQDKIKESSQKLALQRDDVNKEKDIFQQRLISLEDHRKTQAAAYSEKIVALKKAMAESQALPSVADLTVAIAAEQAEQEAIMKSRDNTHTEINVLRDNVTATIADRVREEILLKRTDKEINSMEKKHAAQTKTLADKIESLGITSLKQRLDEAIANNAAASKSNEALAIAKDDLTDKVKNEGSALSKAAAAKQRIEARLAQARTEITATSNTKASTVIASTRLEKNIVEIKKEIGQVKKDTVFVMHQTTTTKEDTENVRHDVRGIVREKTELLITKEDLEDQVEEIEDRIKEIERSAELEALMLKNKRESELTEERKSNNAVIEKLDISREKAASKLINAQTDLASMQVQQIVRGTVVGMYDGQNRRLKQEIEETQEDIKDMKRENTLLSQKSTYSQKIVNEIKAQSLEEAKQVKALENERREVLRMKEDVASEKSLLQQDVKRQETLAQQAEVDSNTTAAVYANTLRDERSLSHVHSEKSKDASEVDKEERRRQLLLAAKANAHASRMNKEKEEFEKKVQQLAVQDNGHINKERSEYLKSLQEDVERLRRERGSITKEANEASKNVHEASKLKTNLQQGNQTLSQEHASVSAAMDVKKKELEGASSRK